MIKDLSSDNIKNFRQVAPSIFAGAQPTLPEGIKELKDTYGIKSILKLNRTDLNYEMMICHNENIILHSVPINGIEIIDCIPKDLVKQALSIIYDESNYPIFIHCTKGADRTGMIVAMYRIDKEGWTVNQALSEMRHYHNALFEFGFRDEVEDYAKELKNANS